MGEGLKFKLALYIKAYRGFSNLVRGFGDAALHGAPVDGGKQHTATGDTEEAARPSTEILNVNKYRRFLHDATLKRPVDSSK